MARAVNLPAACASRPGCRETSLAALVTAVGRVAPYEGSGDA